ncbi:hypothetical protein Leryth_017011 [Lithospermum erythrorhizon]|nr:hypothetical protein Leryth_017011 [Lithospermum erythrorhizon]
MTSKYIIGQIECEVLSMIPETAGEILVLRSFRVYAATCSGVALSLHSVPGVTMLGFRRIPSNMTLFSARLKKTSAQTFEQPRTSVDIDYQLSTQ